MLSPSSYYFGYSWKEQILDKILNHELLPLELDTVIRLDTFSVMENKHGGSDEAS